jgi:hypothetical protein
MTEHDNTPVPNIPLLRKAVEWVEAEAEKNIKEREWNQGDWMRRRSAANEAEGWCGTACCVAGWVGLQADNAQPEMRDGEFTDRMVYPSGMVVHVADYARAALGLTEEQADSLFAGSNTAETIRMLAEEFAEEVL